MVNAYLAFQGLWPFEVNAKPQFSFIIFYSSFKTVRTVSRVNFRFYQINFKILSESREDYKRNFVYRFSTHFNMTILLDKLCVSVIINFCGNENYLQRFLVQFLLLPSSLHVLTTNADQTHTLQCICLGRCCLGLETRAIIKISKNPCYPVNVD